MDGARLRELPLELEPAALSGLGAGQVLRLVDDDRLARERGGLSTLPRYERLPIQLLRHKRGQGTTPIP